MVVLYYAISLVFILIGFVFYTSKIWKHAQLIGLTLIRLGVILFLLEVVCLFTLYLQDGKVLYFQTANDNYKLFKADDELIGLNKPDVSLIHRGVKISHNSEGWRGKPMSGKSARRILCIGGSTTYGVGVNNNETWPYYLDSLMGANWDVLNYGIPGHSSREHLLLIKKQLMGISNKIAEYNIDVILIHAGLNDLRNSHVEVKYDVYNEFHAPTVFGSLGLCPMEQLPKLAALKLLISSLQEVGLYSKCLYHSASYSGQESSDIDENLRSRYEEYLFWIAETLRSNQVDCIFLPQVANAENFYEDSYKWWVPYIEAVAIKPTIDSFNQSMSTVSKTSMALTLDTLSLMNWEVSEFSDPSHLNAKGNLKFAKAVAEKLKGTYE